VTAKGGDGIGDEAANVTGEEDKAGDNGPAIGGSEWVGRKAKLADRLAADPSAEGDADDVAGAIPSVSDVGYGMLLGSSGAATHTA
jgi:hypothetical protein